MCVPISNWYAVLLVASKVLSQNYSECEIKSVCLFEWHQTRMPTQFKYQSSIPTYNIYIILLQFTDGDNFFMNFQIATADSCYEKWYKICFPP